LGNAALTQTSSSDGPYAANPFGDYDRGSLVDSNGYSDPPGDPVPVLLGLEFFLAHQAEFHLPLPPQHGIFRLP
jgi:hypothetical protein